MKTIIIDGIEYELVPKQSTEEKKNDPFDIRKGMTYFFITRDGGMMKNRAGDFPNDDDNLISSANACQDFAIMERRALYEILNRLVWRESVKAGGLKVPWDGKHDHYFIIYHTDTHEFGIDYAVYNNNMTPSFPTRESAQKAINEVVMSFMKEHPRCYF